MELVYFKVLVKYQDNIDKETGELINEGEEEYFTIPIHEIATWLKQSVQFFKSVQVIDKELLKVINKCEYDDLETEKNDLEIENDNLKKQLDVAWCAIDNIKEHLTDMRTRIEETLSDLDDAEEDCQSAKDECEHD